MQLITEKKEDTRKLFTPRGDKPLKGKEEIKEKSWNPVTLSEESQEG